MPPAAASASEHPEPSAPGPSKYRSLNELTPQRVGIGARLLQVADAPRGCESAYIHNGKRNGGTRFEVMLMSPDARVYCIGFFRRKQDSLSGNGESAAAMQACRYNTVWEASNISLANEKACAISSP